MLNYTVLTHTPRYEVSPASLTPGFPPLFGVGGGEFVVFVQPLHVLPNGKNIEREIARDEGVQVPDSGLAVVEFHHHEGVDAANDRGVAADRWCHFARLLGWRLWLFPNGGALPLQEVCDADVGKAVFVHGAVPKVIVAKSMLARGVVSSVISTAPQIIPGAKA